MISKANRTEQPGTVSTADRSRGGARQLADTLLRLTRIGRDLRAPSLKAVDLSEAAQQVVRRMEPIAEGARIALRTEERAWVGSAPIPSGRKMHY